LLLILISFCSSSANTGKFDNILHQFVELNTAMGAAREDVGVLLGQVKATVRGTRREYAEFFRTVETHCASALSRIQGEIKGLGSSINDAQNNLNTWTKNLNSATAEVKSAQANLVKARQQLGALHKKVDKLTLDYREHAVEADKRIIVVKRLRDIITDELFNRVPGLVQVNKFQQTLGELKELLNNNSDSLYTPMITMLLDLATEQNFADQGVLKKILAILGKLDKALKDFRKKQEASLKSELALIRKNVRNTRRRIRDYRRLKHQARSKQIDAGHYINFYRHEIVHFNAEKNRKTDELNLFQKLCAFEKAVHNQKKADVQRFKQVLSVVISNFQKLAR